MNVALHGLRTTKRKQSRPREYFIRFMNGDTRVSRGTSPQDAFRKLYPDTSLTPVQNESQANVCVWLNGANTRVQRNYYIASRRV